MNLMDGKAIADSIQGEISERKLASENWKEQLELGLLNQCDIDFADGYNTALKNVYRQIKDAPTVEVIPVEWIRKQLSKLKDDVKWSWYYGNTAVDKMEWAAMWVEMCLLEKWEKENENS